MGKDFWGRMFDFNGDGKTTLDEEMLGLTLLEEDRKRTAKNLESKPSYNYKEQRLQRCPLLRRFPRLLMNQTINSSVVNIEQNVFVPLLLLL